MIPLVLVMMFVPPQPEQNAVPAYATVEGVWADYPWVKRRVWRDGYFLWCDDPKCPVCSSNIYGWRDVPIRRGK